MRVLVIYGSTELMERTRNIFESYDHHWIFIKDSDIEFTAQESIGLGDYDLIFSLHCKKIFPKWLVSTVRCINIHPGYNPYNRGMFPHVWSIINGLPAGVTIHEMDEKIDNGAILARQRVFLTQYDTSETLYKRVIDAEIGLLMSALGDILDGKLESFNPEVSGNYNSMNDFKKLCEIDLNEHSKTINILRALTHGDYKNAKFGNRHLKLEII